MLMLVSRRLFAALPIIVSAAIFTFVLARLLPGDPAAHLASGMAATPQAIAAMRHTMGLDASIPGQLGAYLWGLLQGDWGQSFVTGEPVLHALRMRLPATLELTLTGFALAALLGVPLGMSAACHVGRWPDYLCRVLTSLFGSLPSFVVGLLLIYLFYFRLGWAPEPTGRIDALSLWMPDASHSGFFLIDALSGPPGTWRDVVRHLVLPALTMAAFGLAPIARITRSAMLDALASDPVRTARSLGLPAHTVLFHYALRLSAPAILTTLGMVFSYMLGANVAVEKVFAWPGIGSYAMDALTAADYAPLQGFVLCIAIVFALLNACVDVLLAWLDPRARTLR